MEPPKVVTVSNAWSIERQGAEFTDRTHGIFQIGSGIIAHDHIIFGHQEVVCIWFTEEINVLSK